MIYLLLNGLSRLLSLIPLRVLRGIGRVIGWLGYYAAVQRRRIALANLRRAYPEKDEAWVRRTARQCFQHLLMVITENIKTFRYSPQQIAAGTRQHGLENIRAASAAGKGVLGLSLHIGNWEWMSLAAGETYQPLFVVARTLDWPVIDKIVNDWRAKTGNSSIPRRNALRRILTLLRQGETVGILLDQSTDWYEGVWVDFFGRPACTVKLLARLAIATGAAVVPIYNYRAADGKLDVYYEPPISTIDTGNPLQDVWDNTQNYSRILEEIIRRRPEQWMWMHRRWKIRPHSPWPRREGSGLPWEADEAD